MSKKYRLIKKLPNFNYKIGTEVSFSEDHESWIISNTKSIIDEDLNCSKNPKFWELVKEDNFKLLLNKTKVDLNDILPYKDPKNKSQLRLNNIAKLQFIEEYYKGNWKINWNSRNQYKYYPYFIKENGVWRVGSHFCTDSYYSLGSLAYFETREKALEVGNKYLDIYISIIEPK